MFTELDVLGLVSDRLTELGLPFMLTGSFALSYYATPRRKLISVAGVRTWVVSREDLILSKLLWARESGSEMQRRDIRLLLDGDLDLDYLERWAKDLGVTGLLEELSP
jgi:hypothetical protein